METAVCRAEDAWAFVSSSEEWISEVRSNIPPDSVRLFRLELSRISRFRTVAQTHLWVARISLVTCSTTAPMALLTGNAFGACGSKG